MKKTWEEIAEEYGSQMIAKTFTPRLEDYFRTTRKFGLAWDSAWISATVSAGNGQKYNLCRGWEKTTSILIKTSRLQEDLSGVSPRLFKHLFVGASSFELLEDKKLIQINSFPARHKFKIEIEVNRFLWQEDDGELDLIYEPLGPALWFFNPGAKIKEDATIEVLEMEREDAEDRWGDTMYDLFKIPPEITKLQIFHLPGWNVNACNKDHTASTGVLGYLKISKFRFRPNKRLLEISYDINT